MAGHLQDVSGKTNETSKAGTGRCESFVGSTSEGGSSSWLSSAGNSVSGGRRVGDVVDRGRGMNIGLAAKGDVSNGYRRGNRESTPTWLCR